LNRDTAFDLGGRLDGNLHELSSSGWALC